MWKHDYFRNGAVFYPDLQDDIEKSKTCDDLLNVARVSLIIRKI